MTELPSCLCVPASSPEAECLRVQEPVGWDRLHMRSEGGLCCQAASGWHSPAPAPGEKLVPACLPVRDGSDFTQGWACTCCSWAGKSESQAAGPALHYRVLQASGEVFLKKGWVH